MPLSDPFRSQTFYLELGGVFNGPLLKIMGLTYEREVKTVQQATAGGKIIINQLPGKYMPATITIHKAITSHKGFWDWRKKVLDGEDIAKIRVNGTISVHSKAITGAVLKWNLVNAWPSRIKGPVLDIQADAAHEEIEICYEELQQVEG